MSGLNFLNKLLDGVDVEWLSLGELGDFIRGNGLQKKDFVESGFPAIHYGQIYTRYGLSADKTFTYVLPELANKLRKAQKNDLLLATTSENDEDVVKPLAWLGDNVAISGDMMLFRHEQNVKYLAYFFQSEIFQTQKMKYITGAKVRRVSSGDLSKIKIPIPCSNNPEKSLAIQSEIVRILDKFTALTAELTAELNMRKKQYNYYRDQLLSFKDGEVEWKTLGEVAQYSKTRISFELLDERNYVGVDNLLQNRAGKSLSNHVPTSGKLTEFIPTDILIGNIRPYLKKIWQADCIGGTNGDVLVIRCIDSSINTRYLYQILADDKFFEYNMQHAKGAKMPRGSKEDIMKYPIPVPPLTLQARIVEILNKFDTLTNSITEGLPREIELRQKQYEYYRDLLFSFPKPETASN
ncbi:TPA: restriction endonuclease subunit S [Escherichia coli]|uniref:restriction endonuclease subunit S n=1 Tax=Escherichia coli TaxID=562 RepID=UPI00102D8B05|nr:restriction endonuclease subunit S [Escherichia coli]EFA4307559.1 restriction endonuclease subunit S [Escherichia coli O19]EEW0965144.1 restriction endonuclease subunit S [Escherichia coli]MBM3036050.1 restriction endonuclease subunit S [Escherichia coli]RZW55856.1 restriction endonuclease subunit S [Escherichia coli]RZZ70378.1 restriction endonuclease subunit S [Escherichia coli]